MSDSDSEDDEAKYIQRIIDFVRIEKGISDSSSGGSSDNSDGEDTDSSKTEKRRRSSDGSNGKSPDRLKRRRSSNSPSSDIEVLDNTASGNPQQTDGGDMKCKKLINHHGTEEYAVENLSGKLEEPNVEEPKVEVFFPRKKPGPLSRTRPKLMCKLKLDTIEVPSVSEKRNSGHSTPVCNGSAGSTSVSSMVALPEETDDENYLLDEEKILGMFNGEDIMGGTSDEMEHSFEENSRREENQNTSRMPVKQESHPYNTETFEGKSPPEDRKNSSRTSCREEEQKPTSKPQKETQPSKERSDSSKPENTFSKFSKSKQNAPKSSKSENTVSKFSKSDNAVLKSSKSEIVVSKPSKSENVATKPENVVTKSSKTEKASSKPSKTETGVSKSTKSEKSASKSSKPENSVAKSSKSSTSGSGGSKAFKERNQDETRSAKSAETKVDIISRVSNVFKSPIPSKSHKSPPGPSPNTKPGKSKTDQLFKPDEKKKKLKGPKSRQNIPESPQAVKKLIGGAIKTDGAIKTEGAIKSEGAKKTEIVKTTEDANRIQEVRIIEDPRKIERLKKTEKSKKTESVKKTECVKKTKNAKKTATPASTSSFILEKYVRPSPTSLNRIPLTPEALLARYQKNSKLSMTSAKKTPTVEPPKKNSESGKTCKAIARETNETIPPDLSTGSTDDKLLKATSSGENTGILRLSHQGNIPGRNATDPSKESAAETGNIPKDNTPTPSNISSNNELFSRSLRIDRRSSTAENIPYRNISEQPRPPSPLSDLGTRRSVPVPGKSFQGEPLEENSDRTEKTLSKLGLPNCELCKEFLSFYRKDFGVNEAIVCQLEKVDPGPFFKSKPSAQRSSPESPLTRRLSHVDLPSIELSVEVLSEIDIALNPISF